MIGSLIGGLGCMHVGHFFTSSSIWVETPSIHNDDMT